VEYLKSKCFEGFLSLYIVLIILILSFRGLPDLFNLRIPRGASEPRAIQVRRRDSCVRRSEGSGRVSASVRILHHPEFF